MMVMFTILIFGQTRIVMFTIFSFGHLYSVILNSVILNSLSLCSAFPRNVIIACFDIRVIFQITKRKEEGEGKIFPLF